MLDALPERFAAPAERARLALIAESHERLLGTALVAPGVDVPSALWRAPAVIVAHGTEVDPLFFFGNRAALDRFEIALESFVGLPSRRSAEPVARDERALLLARVARDGFITDYSGVRVSASGRRFRIEQATVWNLVDAAGALHGQAARFDRWIDLEGDAP